MELKTLRNQTRGKLVEPNLDGFGIRLLVEEYVCLGQVWEGTFRMLLALFSL